MRKSKAPLIAMILLAVLSAGVVFPSGNPGPARPPTEAEKKSDELSASIDPSLIDANTGFAFAIFQELIAEDPGQNIFISPLSILLALAMTYNGAGGDTDAAMAEALRFSGFTVEALNRGFRDLMASITGADNTTTVSIANSIWYTQGYDVAAEFVETNRSYYGSEVGELDFRDAAAVDTINAWIEDATAGKITNMIGRIPPDVVMYLINAIYFKGEWTHRFSEDESRDEDFILETGGEKKVPMMHMEEEFRYARAAAYGMLRLPYGREKLVMYVLLPDEGTGVDAVIGGLDSESWKSLKSQMEDKTAVLAMPRYRFEYGAKSLNGALSRMGMGMAFGPGADFSGINPGIFISEVLHKAVIEVNEKGSEAAAATAVSMEESAPPERIEFIVNRPFLFLIADDRTGSILFMGKVVDP